MEIASAVEIVSLAELPTALSVVAQWYYEAWGCEDGLTFEAEQHKLRESLTGATLPKTYLALMQGNPIGAAQLKLREMPQFPEYVYWLGSVYVAPSARSSGVAQALVHFVAKQAQAQGIDRLYLQTEDLTGGLYHRCGWVPVSCAESHRRQVLVMECWLGPNNSFKPTPLRGAA